MPEWMVWTWRSHLMTSYSPRRVTIRLVEQKTFVTNDVFLRLVHRAEPRGALAPEIVLQNRPQHAGKHGRKLRVRTHLAQQRAERHALHQSEGVIGDNHRRSGTRNARDVLGGAAPANVQLRRNRAKTPLPPGTMFPLVARDHFSKVVRTAS